MSLPVTEISLQLAQSIAHPSICCAKGSGLRGYIAAHAAAKSSCDTDVPNSRSSSFANSVRRSNEQRDGILLIELVGKGARRRFTTLAEASISAFPIWLTEFAPSSSTRHVAVQASRMRCRNSDSCLRRGGQSMSMWPANSQCRRCRMPLLRPPAVHHHQPKEDRREGKHDAVSA